MTKHIFWAFMLMLITLLTVNMCTTVHIAVLFTRRTAVVATLMHKLSVPYSFMVV